MAYTIQTPAPAQLEYINKWIKDYSFPTDVYVYACNITMKKCQRPNVNFTESILKRWKEKMCIHLLMHRLLKISAIKR